MGVDEAFELLLVTGLRLGGWKKMAESQYLVARASITHPDGTRLDDYFDLSAGTVAALAEESGYLHVCVTAQDVELMAARHMVQENQRRAGAEVDCLTRATKRGAELVFDRMDRRWHERAYLSN